MYVFPFCLSHFIPFFLLFFYKKIASLSNSCVLIDNEEAVVESAHRHASLAALLAHAHALEAMGGRYTAAQLHARSPPARPTRRQVGGWRTRIRGRSRA